MSGPVRYAGCGLASGAGRPLSRVTLIHETGGCVCLTARAVRLTGMGLRLSTGQG